MKKIYVVFTVLVMLSSLAFGQLASNNDVYGTVVSPDGSPIPGVAVTLYSDVFGTRTTVSSEDGSFRFIKVPPGSYKLTIELEGFNTVVKKISNRSGSCAFEMMIDERGGLSGFDVQPTSTTVPPKTIVKPERKTEKIILFENHGINPEKKKALPKKECSFYYKKKKLYAKYGVAKVKDTNKTLKDITEFPYNHEEYITEGLEIISNGVYVVKNNQEGKLLFVRILKIYKDKIKVKYLPPK